MGVYLLKYAWSVTKWKGFPESEKEYEKNFEYAKSYSWVKESGLAVEWWCFYEGFDKNYYWGWMLRPSAPIEDGSILFVISKGPSQKSGLAVMQFVGVYGHYIKDEKTFNLRELLTEEQLGWLKKKAERNLKDVLKEISKCTYNFKSPKELSFVLDKYIEVDQKKYFGTKLGQASYAKIGKKKYPKFIELLQKAKDENPNLSDKIDKIIEKLKSGEQGGSFGGNKNKYSLNQILSAISTKPFIIFAGISGTGKTQIARIIASVMTKEKNKY
mgnify:CR=1 FL=1